MDEDNNSQRNFRVSSIDILIGLYFHEIIIFIETIFEESVIAQRILIGFMVMTMLVACFKYVYWSREAERLEKEVQLTNKPIIIRRREDQ